MKFSIAIVAAAVLGTSMTAQAAHLAACTENLDGSGPYVESATRYCCPAVHGALAASAAYSESNGDCRTGITNGNAVDAGGMAKCCDKEGFGTTSQ